MKKLVSLLLAVGLACASSAQTVNPSVQKTSGTNVISNGPIVIGSGNSETIASGGTFTVASGATFNVPTGSLSWASLTAIPSPTFSVTGDGTLAMTLLPNTGATAAFTLATSGVTAGSYGSATVSPTFTVDAKGRVTAVTNNTITASGIGALAVANNLSDVAVASTARTNLGLAIGTNVEAWSSNLDGWSAKTPFAGTLSITTGKSDSFANSLTFSGTDGSTLNVGAGGTLGNLAFSANPMTTAGDLIVGGTSGALARLGIGANGYILSSNGTTEVWEPNVTGTVTAVTVTTANGVSATVANQGTTPALTFSLGAITPSTVNGNTITTGTGTLTLGAGKTATINNTLTFTGTDSSSLNIGTGGALGSNAFTSTAFVPQTTTVNGHALSSNVTVSASDVGLGNVTNNTQTQASIVPNTVPASGQILVGNGSAYVPGSLTGDFSIGYPATGTITANAVTNAKLAQAPTLTLKGNSTGSTANEQDLTVSQVNTMLGTFVNPMTTAGDLIVGGFSGAPSRLGLGASGTVPTSNGSTITWQTPSSGTGGTAYTSWANMKVASTTGWVNGTVAQLAGYYNPGDGGGGTFVWESADTTADNGGTVMQITGVSTGRLHRVIPSSNYQSQLPNTTLDIRWFGAIPDNTTDCTPGILAAENSAIFSGSNETPTLYAPAGQYAIKTKLNLSAGSVGSFNLKGDGANATIFVCNFSSTDTAMWDLGNFATLTSIQDCGFSFASASTSLPQYLYLHQGAQLDLQNIRAANFTGTFINIYNFNTWGRVENIVTANNAGTQILVNGLGGVISNFNLSTGYGPPCLMVENCNALDIHDGQVSGGGPYKSFTGCALTSTGSTFTITQAGHGFTAGDYIYISSATNSGYVSRWKIASVTSSTITVSSTAALGSDTVSFGSLWSQVYFGGAGATGNLCTESSMHHVISNSGSESTVSGSCGFFFDGWNGSGIAGIKCNNLLADYGNTGFFCHGTAASAYDGTNSFIQGVITSTANSFTLATGTASANIGSFVTGNWYCIETVGTGNNWTSIGASSAAVGVVFQATGPGAGGSGGTAALLTAHSLKPGGYLRVTGGAYLGFWLINSVTTYTVTCSSTLNAGPLITVPAEGDVISSSCGGLTLDRCTAYTGDTFGGIRVEGGNDISINAPQIDTPGGGSHFTTGPFTSIVFSDGGQTIPQFDLQVVGGVITNIGQTAYYPTTTKYGINIDGVNVTGVQVKAVVMTGSVTPFEFTSSATPNTCNLDTDFFKGVVSIMTLPSGGQSFTSGSAASVTWTTPTLDPMGMWSATNPLRITPPVGAQLVQLNAKTAWGTGVTPASLQIFHYNSSGTLLEQNGQAYGANTTPSLAQTVNSGPVSIQPGDYFQMWASQSSGSTATLNNGSPTGNVGFSLQVIK